jgi:hypothetical protein
MNQSKSLYHLSLAARNSAQRNKIKQLQVNQINANINFKERIVKYIDVVIDFIWE